MHKGRQYPQTANRWKLNDCTRSFYLPRQNWGIARFYTGVFEHDFHAGSAFAPDGHTDLIERYDFPRLSFGGHWVELTLWFDGTNDLDQRGFYQHRKEDTGYEAVDFTQWVLNYSNCYGNAYGIDTVTSIIVDGDSNWGAGTGGAVDWYAYPANQEWAPTLREKTFSQNGLRGGPRERRAASPTPKQLVAIEQALEYALDTNERPRHGTDRPGQP
jgi:hypothetical protein